MRLLSVICVLDSHVKRTHIFCVVGTDLSAPYRVPRRVVHVLLDHPRHSGSRRRHLGHSTPDVTLHYLLGDDSAGIQTANLFSYISSIKFPVQNFSRYLMT